MSSEKIKKWRHETKKRIIESMGGKCQICGYNKCNSALDLHHIKPEEKEISLGAIRANPKSWNTVIVELRKCVLICANCHREVHEGITEIPESISTFDEKYADYITVKKEMQKSNMLDRCPVCNKEKSITQKTCSNKCAGTLRNTVDWDNVDLKTLLEKYSREEIGRQLNVTGAAVTKRAKKLNLI